MDLNLIKSNLLDSPYLSAIKTRGNANYSNKDYEVLINCELYVNKCWYPIVIGIPKDWMLTLVDIYVLKNEIPHIPHFEKNGKLCLYNTESSIIEPNLLGILNQCILQAKKILEKGIKKENWNEFLDEFNSYIACQPNCKRAKVVIPELKKSLRLPYCPIWYSKKKNNNKHSRTIEADGYFASIKTSDFKEWEYRNSHKSGLFLYSEIPKVIYPPEINKPISFNYLNKIFENIKDISLVKKIVSKIYKQDKNLFVIFNLKQPNGIYNTFGVILSFPKFEFKPTLKLKKSSMITPIVVERLDEETLLSRTSFYKNSLSNKNYLLIGCGSIGGFIYNVLIKSGCKNITLLDDDRLTSQNIYRHLLGRDYIDSDKVLALEEFGKRSLPNLNISTISKTIQDAVKDSEINFENFDYVVASTGDVNVNMWINKYIHKNKIKTPVFYVWNETLDIGSHVAAIQFTDDACYQCILRKDELFGLYDSISYCKPRQDFTRSVSGCNGTFIPYGSLISLQSSLLFLDLLKKFAEKRITGNTVVSEKGDDYYFKKAGFCLSKNYTDQKEKILIRKGTDFKNPTCIVCGNDIE